MIFRFKMNVCFQFGRYRFYEPMILDVSSISDRISTDALLCLSIGAICPPQNNTIFHFCWSSAAFLSDDIKVDCNGKGKNCFSFPAKEKNSSSLSFFVYLFLYAAICRDHQSA